MAVATRIKTGDTVRHRPTGEEWVVAYADYASNRLAWCGWPEGSASIDDCDLIESCDEEWSERIVNDLLNINGVDARKRWAQREQKRREEA